MHDVIIMVHYVSIEVLIEYKELPTNEKWIRNEQEHDPLLYNYYVLVRGYKSSLMVLKALVFEFFKVDGFSHDYQ